MKTDAQLRKKRLVGILPQIVLTLAVLAIFIFRTAPHVVENERTFFIYCLNVLFVGMVTFFVMSLACMPLIRLAFPDADERPSRLRTAILTLWFAQNFGILLLFIAICGVGLSGYYLFLRYFICALTLACAACGLKLRTYFWAVVFILIALLFNPFVPVQLGRGKWMLVDWLLIALLVYNPIANASDAPNAKS